MNVNSQFPSNEFQMDAAITLYSATGKGFFDEPNDAGNAYAMIHPIRQTGGRPEIAPGRPMTTGDLQKLVKSLAPKDRPELVWQDDCVLAKGLNRMIWWTPKMTRPMFFNTSSKAKKTFDGSAICPVPAMVWMTVGAILYVYAIEGNERPRPDTPLYQAPLFNVWASGQVCMGTAKAPEEGKRSQTKEWEKTLFVSVFTHPNFTEKDRLVRGISPQAFWQDMVKSPLTDFPEKRLVAIPAVVGDLLKTDLSPIDSLKAKGEF